MNAEGFGFRLRLLQAAPVILLALVAILFTSVSPRFLTLQNAENILSQSAYVAIVAIGMTFVMLIAGIDLSVGATMYVSAAVVGLGLPTLPAPLVLLAMAAIGAVFGAINALFIAGLRIAAFIATLAMLFIGRGLALYLSDTKMVFAGDPVLEFGQGAFLGVPFSIWVLVAIFALSLYVERLTPFGRYLYAIGADPEAARKAGIPVRLTTAAAYMTCGILAAVGGFVSFSQVAAASSTFGLQMEFAAIAAAVLGGTSLFGGRGSVVGAVFGAVLIQTVQNGLVLNNANPYFYPMVVSAIIFVAVLIDSLRTRVLDRLTRRQIRIEPGAAESRAVEREQPT